MATESGAENKAAEAKKGNPVLRFFKWVWTNLKLAALELKKTTWPKPADVLKKLGIVTMVVLFFFVVLLAMDIVLTMGFRALTGRDPWYDFWSIASAVNQSFLLNLIRQGLSMIGW